MLIYIKLDWTTDPVKKEGFYYALLVGEDEKIRTVIVYVEEWEGLFGCACYIGKKDNCTMGNPKIIPMDQKFLMWAEIPDAMIKD